jgi:hypothetical protein
LAIRHKSAVIQAPTPKKKITNPGRINSSRKRTSPIINQISSGLEKTDVLIIISLKYRRDNCFVFSKDMTKTLNSGIKE